MVNTVNPHEAPAPPPLYAIRVQGHLDARWVDWFDGLGITRLDNGETVLRGPMRDQAALHGVLRNIRDLGLPLLSVSIVAPDPTPAPAPGADVSSNDQRGIS